MGTSAGFCRDLLQSMVEITKSGTPEYKIQPNGFTRMLISAMSPGAIKNDSYNGHFKTVVVKKKQRFIRADTDTSESCDNTLVPAYTEDTVSVANIRQIAFHINDEVIAEYCDGASATSSVGRPNIAIMQEFLDTLMSAADALLDGVEFDLVNLMKTRFGVNRVTGLATARTLNLNKDETINPIGNGMNMLKVDFKRNQFMGRPLVVGGGNMLAFMEQQNAKSAAQDGLDTSIQAAGVDFFYSEEFASQMSVGGNNIGVFEKDAVQIVEYLRYQGFKAGVKPGGSVFGTIPIPVQGANGEIQAVMFDFQLKYNDCPQTFTDAYTGASLGSLPKGYNMIISKQFGLYTIPTTAYKAGDVLLGNRGSLLYDVTNTCETCA